MTAAEQTCALLRDRLGLLPLFVVPCEEDRGGRFVFDRIEVRDEHRNVLFAGPPQEASRWISGFVAGVEFMKSPTPEKP